MKGAAIATLTSELVFSLYMFSYFQIVRRIKMMKYLLKPFISATFMGFVLYYFRNLSLFFSISMGIIIYIIAILLLKGVTFRELIELRRQIMEKG
ncbi:hypothetical protein ES703_108690 [subsurface metagenome]